MPYAILRFQKRKAGGVAACERHNERKKEDELDSLWLEQAVSKAIEERVTIESTIAWENLFFIIISSFLVCFKKQRKS